MGGQPIMGKLAVYFKNRPGVQIFAEDLTNDLSETRKRVLGGMVNLLQRGVLPGLHRLSNGGPWIYHPNGANPASTDKSYEIFEMRGKTRSGDLILESEEGILYRAKELE